MKNKKILIGVLVSVVLIIIINVFFFWYLKPKNKKKSSSSSVPSQEVTGGQETPQDTNDGEDLPAKQDQGAEQKQPGQSGSGASDQASSSFEGVLIGDGNPWKLIYDDLQSSSAAATLILVFTDQSVCDAGGGVITCSPMMIEMGTQIQVEGVRSGDQLTVISLKRSVALMGQ